MEIIDKEKSEEQKKKSTLVGILWRVLVFAVLGVGIYLMDKSSFFSGEPYPIGVGNATILPGETTVQEVAQAGYEFADILNREWVMEDYTAYTYYPEAVDLTTELEAKTYANMALIKDGRSYAKVTVYNNESVKKKPLAECRISAVETGDLYEHEEETSLLGIPFLEVTEEAVTSNLGMEPEISGSGLTVWKKKKYSVSIRSLEESGGKVICSEYELD